MAKKQTTKSTPKQTLDELTEVSQEMGLYDITGNPLVKDTSTINSKVPTEAVESVAEEMNTKVAETAKNDSSMGLEPLDSVDELGGLLDKATEGNKPPELIPSVEVEVEGQTLSDKQTLKDGWGNPIPTRLVVIQSMNYTDLVSQALHAGYLGSQLDSSFRILSTVPFRIRVLMPEDQYENFLSKESQVVFDEDLTYNKVLVKSWDLYGFWKSVLSFGEKGGIVQPRHVAQKRPMYMVPILTRAPVSDTPESRVGREKIKYTKEELDNFSLDELKIIGNWYNIPNMNAKKNYVKDILIRQG